MLLLISGFYVLGNVVIATAISVFVIGWTALVGGVFLLIGALVSIRASGMSWSTLLGGAVLAVLGLFILRNPLVGAVALTLMAGALFFTSGIARVGLAMTLKKHRLLFLFSGLVSIGLGLWIIVNPGAATLTLLGVLLGIQVLSEGVTLILAGRLRVAEATVPEA